MKRAEVIVEDESSDEEENEEPQEETHDELKKHTKEGITPEGIHIGSESCEYEGHTIYEWLPVPENIPEHPSMCFFGKRRTGKSTTIMNIAYHAFQSIPFGIVLSNTAFAGYWEKYVPKQYIFQGLRADILKALTDRQKRLIREYGKEDPKTFAFIIMDDVIADQKAVRWNPELQGFFVEGRHLNITIILATQNVKGVGPMIRRNLDYAFIQPIREMNELDALYELFGASHIENKKEWRNFIKEIVKQESLPGSTAAEPKKKVRIMVVANFEVANEIDGQFFWWNPVHTSELPAFRLCHKYYWDQAETANTFAGSVRTRKLDPVSVLDEFDVGLNC